MLGDMIVYRAYEVYVLPGAFNFLGLNNDLQGSDGFLEDFIMALAAVFNGCVL